MCPVRTVTYLSGRSLDWVKDVKAPGKLVTLHTDYFRAAPVTRPQSQVHCFQVSRVAGLDGLELYHQFIRA